MTLRKVDAMMESSCLLEKGPRGSLTCGAHTCSASATAWISLLATVGVIEGEGTGKREAAPQEVYERGKKKDLFEPLISEVIETEDPCPASPILCGSSVEILARAPCSTFEIPGGFLRSLCYFSLSTRTR
ncbi:hypothetical protein Taro_017906 [Colocasia esculenta]|uniref:Uncharacterized protein n=1 Tax=Colocasia esculenta TaxID=4460 RepID=A0A843USC7_COLES|nr:hypothetical protein [Colocasia esculenta]